MKPKSSQRHLLALAGSSLLTISSASAQTTYTWANSNVDNTTPKTRDWFTGGSNPQGTWSTSPGSQGSSAITNADTVQFFANTTTALANTSAVIQNSNVNNGGTTVQLGTLTLSGRGSGTGGANFTMNLSGDALNFSAATGTVNLAADPAGRTFTYNVANNIQLGTAGSATALTFTGGGTANFNFTGNITSQQAGTSTVTKSGSSTLVLSGINTFNGLTLNGGNLRAGNNSTSSGNDNFGASGSTISVISNSTISYGAGVSYAFDKAIDIASGVTLTMVKSAAGSHTYQGVLSGGDDTTLIVNDAGSIGQRTLDFSNTANTFTGTIDLQNNQSTVSFSSLSDASGAGNIKFGTNAGRSGAFQLGSGAVAPLVLTNRKIEIIAGGSVSGTAAIYNNATSNANTLRINSDLLVTGSGGTKTLELRGTNAGNNTFGGVIANGGLTTLGLNKADAGTWVLSNSNNSYTGTTQVSNGRLVINSIANYTQPSSIGAAASGSIILGNDQTTGTLEYRGGAAETNRTFQIGTNNNAAGTGGILNNGTGTLTFTNATFNQTYTSSWTQARALTLGGTNDGVIQGTIQNSSTTITHGITKVGSGTWTLGGTNTYTGTTSISSGTLELRQAGTGRTQTNGPLTFGVSDGTLASNNAGTGTLSTTFTTLTRSVGATGNFISTGGTNGTTNIINTTGAAGFMGRGLFYNSSEFAWRDNTNGYVRGINYGVDGSTVENSVATTNTHIKLTASASRAGGIEISSLLLVGNGVNYSNSSGSNMNGGIIKSGGGTSLISGAGRVGVAGNQELVVNTVASNDVLEITSQLDIFNVGITKTGAGTLILSNANNLTGSQIYINSGTLSVGANGNLGNQASGATVHLRGGTLRATGTFGLFNGTAGTNNRNVTLLNQSGIEVTGSNTLTIAGAISNNASAGFITPGFNKTGTGTLVISNTNNTYTGATTVSEGTLVVNGSIASSSLTTVSSGATISGSGTIGALTVSTDGFISPGNSPGILNTGDYTQAGLYTAEINGLTPGTEHDQIIVTGTVDITGGSLSALFSGAYAENDLIFILVNDGLDPITGTFTGLPQGASVTSYGGFDWQISYLANNTGIGTGTFTGGNDIALMAVSLNSTVIPEPSAFLLGSFGLLAAACRRRR